MHRRLTILSVVVVLLCGSLVAAAVARTSSATGGVASASPVRQVDASIISQLSVFDGATTTTEDLPDPILSYLETENAEGLTNFPELARKVQTDAGDFYLVPGDGTICRIGGAAMACGDSSYLSREPLGYMLFSKPSNLSEEMVIVSGIAADNVQQLTAVQPDGRRIDIGISGNAYATAVPTATIRIEMQTSDMGLLTTTLPHEVQS